MSHFVSVATVFKDVGCLVKALEHVCPHWAVRVGEGQVLYGYAGDDRSMAPRDGTNFAPPCVIRIDRTQVGTAANDFGVSRSHDGLLTLHISEYDQRCSGLDEAWVGRVKQQYQLAVLKKEAKRHGHRVEHQVKDDGRIVGKVVVS